jgi:hypothetical protein
VTKLYDDDDERDAPQDIDLDRGDEGDDDDGEMVRCANCGHRFVPIVDRCPRCGYYIEDESVAAQRSRGGFWPIVVALLIAIIVVMWIGLGR